MIRNGLERHEKGKHALDKCRKQQKSPAGIPEKGGLPGIFYTIYSSIKLSSIMTPIRRRIGRGPGTLAQDPGIDEHGVLNFLRVISGAPADRMTYVADGQRHGLPGKSNMFILKNT